MNSELFKAMAADLAKVAGRAAESSAGLLDYMVQINPGYRRLNHFADLAARCERAVTVGGERFTSHAPPRHGKTELMLTLVPWAWRRRPTMQFLYATYGDSLSDSKSRRCQEMARCAGFTITKESASEWRTKEGGVFRATSIGGPATGEGADMLLVDDFFKNRAEAESGARRKFVWDWITDVGLQRLSPNGSAWVNAARWHVLDPTGQLQKMGWPYLRFPALQEAALEVYDAVLARYVACSDETEAARIKEDLAEAKANLRPLWPEQWGVDALLERRRLSEHSWLSLQQGSPRPRGGKLFHDVYRYDELPHNGYRDALGVDLAYAAKTSSDSSALVHFRRVEDLLYVVHAIKQKVDAPTFMQRIGGYQAAMGNPHCGWYTSTTEAGAALLGSGFGATIVPMPTGRNDKFARAQPYAASWNAGRVLVPSDAPPWLDSFLDAHLDFTGVGDEDDDEVDAAVAAHDLLAPGSVFGSSEAGEDEDRRRMFVARRDGGRGSFGGRRL